jgi:hypothetical protein
MIVNCKKRTRGAIIWIRWFPGHILVKDNSLYRYTLEDLKWDDLSPSK